MENNLPEWRYFLRGCLRVTKWCAITALVLLAFNVIGYWVHRLDWIFWAEPGSFRQFQSYWGRVSSLAVIGLLHTVMCVGIAMVAGFALYVAYLGLLYAGGYRDPKSAVQAHPTALPEENT